LLVALVIVAGGVVTLALLSAFSRRPDNLGIRDGKLSPCPATPNGVCTQAEDASHRSAPLTYVGSAADAMARLKRLVIVQPGVHLLTETQTYLRAEFVSRVFRFVDDVEFLLDAQKQVIHFRSASRAGRSDFGVNRRRMEGIRRAFTERMKSEGGRMRKLV
jgi:uncharacterized protein (DUF1499 family)